MSEKRGKQRPGFFSTLGGVCLFFAFQYGIALQRLNGQSSGMENKFSALAQDKYLGFLVLQNLYVLLGYAILAVLFALVLRPLISGVLGKISYRPRLLWFAAALAGSFLIHGFFTLRLVKTRPYFLNDAKFGHWYFELLNLVPEGMRAVFFFGLFTLLPLLVVAYAIWWYWRRLSLRARIGSSAVVVMVVCLIAWKSDPFPKTAAVTAGQDGRPLNVIIIGSDSLRGDQLGYTGYRPRRSDGAAAEGVSPNIDRLAEKSFNLSNCHTSIASTLESGTSLMSAQYPHTHGLRQMYPSEETVRKTKATIRPIAEILRERGYDTAAIGDWCAGYYELMPMGFEHVSVSSFDNFKIYMSQAVVMSHFVIPLYFDHSIGYEIFPQLGSFAQFVTPKVVTKRVKDRLERAAESEQPFFWHVFYSCNHLPYRTREPYSSMFTDPEYSGPNQNGVDFDIDEFIGGTDLENKWSALPEKEIQQIRDLYDGCTRMFDDHVGEILKALEQSEFADNTIVIITADHGDNLYEEGVTLGHGLTFNGGLHANHVPLVMHVPGAEAKEIPQQVNLIDLMPTLADMLYLEKPDAWEGQSFAGWLAGSETPQSRPFYGETGFPFIQFRVESVERPELPPMDQMTGIDDSFNYQFVLKEQYEKPLLEAKQRCLVSAQWKLICTPTKEGQRHFGLFQRTDEGFSHRDVSEEFPEVLSAMREALELWMDAHREMTLEEIFPEGE